MTFAPRPREVETGEPGAPEVDPQLFERVATVARIVAGDQGMKVHLGPPGQGSAYNSETGEMMIDSGLINPEKLWQAEFVAGHEGSHRAIFRGPQQIGLKLEVIEELWSQLGFGYLDNVREDAAGNSWMMKKFPGLREPCRRNYDKEFARENIILSSPEVEEFITLLGYEPKFAHYGSEVLRSWHAGRFSENLDPDVRAALEATHEAIKRAYETIPGPVASEKERVRKARERFLITLREVWPEYQKLVVQDLSTEKVRQMIKEFYEGLERELERRLKEFLPEPLGQEYDDLKQKWQAAVKEGKPPVIAMDEMSDELKQKLAEFLEKLLGLDKQKKLEEQARKTLEELEDKLNKVIEAKLNPETAPSHEDIRKGALFVTPPRVEAPTGPPQTSPEDKKREAEELARVRAEIAEARDGSMTEYDKYYREVVGDINKLQERLERIFRPEKRPRWKGGHPTGEQVGLGKAMEAEAREEAGATPEERIWERKTVPKKMDYRFVLVVDLSGSMEDKIAETMKGVIELAEVLDRLGIPVEITGLGLGVAEKAQAMPRDLTYEQNHEWLLKLDLELSKLPKAMVYKSFHERLDPETRKKIMQMYHDRGGGTPTAIATQLASESLDAFKGKHNFIITFTDGAPDDAYSTHQKISAAKKKGQKCVGVGLGPDTEFVSDYYSASIHEDNVKKFPERFADLLEDLIQNPDKYK